MRELGMKSEVSGTDLLVVLPRDRYRGIFDEGVTRFPSLPDGEAVICGYDQGLGQRLIVCENLAEMQELDRLYRAGSALRITWYMGPDPGAILVIDLSPLPEDTIPDEGDADG